jgi:cytochrome c oxidase assembly factor CtaG
MTAPVGLLAVVGALASMVSLVRRPAPSIRMLAQSGVALVSWAALWVACASGFARDGMSNLPVHMVNHIIVMFMVPMGLIYSGFGRSTWWLMKTSTRRRVLRWWYVDRRFRVPGWLAHPIVATLTLNAVMVAAHTPRIFDALMGHEWAMNWIMEPAFLLSGIFFFHYIVSSPPRKIHVRLRDQLFMVTFTMFEMLLLAMAMSIFTRTSWYAIMDPVTGMSGMPGMSMHATTLAQAFHEQQLSAAILWICGDFWAIPSLVVIVRRVTLRDGSLFQALDRQTRSLSNPHA